MLCDKCLYNKNCQYLAKTKVKDICACSAYVSIEEYNEKISKQVATEICKDAREWVRKHYKDKVEDSFGERPMFFMESFGCLISYLMDKYEVK